jgi:hypothetical protein
VRIFFSLRFDEWREFAGVLKDDLGRYGFQPVHLDDQRSDHRAPPQRSLSELATCDAVVVLIAHTRGAPDADGTTIVEDEFHEARRLLKPVHCFRLSTVDERSETWPFVTEVERTVTVGILPDLIGRAAMCIVADLLHLPLGSGDSIKVGPLLTSTGLHEEAARLGFSARLVYRSEPGDADLKRRLLQHQEWAFRGIADERPLSALVQLRLARDKAWPDDWLTNYALAWLVANTNSRELLAEGLAAAQTAVQTALGWRAASSDPADVDLKGPARLNASRIMMARLAMLDGDLMTAAELVDLVLEHTPNSAVALRERFRIAARDDDVESALVVAEGLRRNHAPALVSLLHEHDVDPAVRHRIETRLIAGMPAPLGPDDVHADSSSLFSRRIARLTRDLNDVLADGRRHVLGTIQQLRTTAAELGPERRPVTTTTFALLETVIETERRLVSHLDVTVDRLTSAVAAQSLRSDVSSAIAEAESEVGPLRGELADAGTAIAEAEDRIERARSQADEAAEEVGPVEDWVAWLMTLAALVAVLGLVLCLFAWRRDWIDFVLRGLLTVGASTVVMGAWHTNWRGARQTIRWQRARRKARALRAAERRATELNASRESTQRRVSELDARLRNLRHDQHQWSQGAVGVESLHHQRAIAQGEVTRVRTLRLRLQEGSPQFDAVSVRGRLREIVERKDSYASWAALLLPMYVPVWQPKPGRPTTLPADLRFDSYVIGGLPRSHERDRLVVLVGEADDARWRVSDLAMFAGDDTEAAQFREIEEFVLHPHGAISASEADQSSRATAN